MNEYIEIPNKITGDLYCGISDDGTLIVTVPDGSNVNRVFVVEENAYCGEMYYKND